MSSSVSRILGATGVAIVVAGFAWVAWPSAPGPAAQRHTAAPVSGREGERASPCAHPYVPSTPGITYTYRVEHAAGVESFRVRVAGTRRAGDEHEVTWQTLGESETQMTRRCGTAGAEEPWLAFGSGAGGLEVRAQTWRVPRVLAVHDEYSGSFTAVMRVPGSDHLNVTVRRSHRVVGREVITAAGRSFDALRVDVEDRTDLAREPIPMIQWLAEDVGLVRLAMGPEGYRTVVTLVAVE